MVRFISEGPRKGENLPGNKMKGFCPQKCFKGMFPQIDYQEYYLIADIRKVSASRNA
jgi:hypothetical protein